MALCEPFLAAYRAASVSLPEPAFRLPREAYADLLRWLLVPG